MKFQLPEEDRARGLMAGLLLGDAIGGGELELSGVLHGTCLAQLACFTLEGMIRASVRASHRGICHPPSVVWRAYNRWAAVQGVHPSPEALDGWVHQIAPIAIRRGSAPATVAALRSGAMGTQEAAAPGSSGHHALTRTLPVALFAASVDDVAKLARELASLTHGSPDAWDTACKGTLIVARALQETSVERTLAAFGVPSAGRPGTALAALVAGCTGARAFPKSSQLVDGILAAKGCGGAGGATFAGALLGAQHGYLALPQNVLGRLEIGWVADRLAQDAVLEQAMSPSGSEYSPAPDGSWWARYPGW